MAASLTACASSPAHIEGVSVDIYLSKPAGILPGGMRLNQDGKTDFVPYEKTLNWRCLKEDDWVKILNILRPPVPEWP